MKYTYYIYLILICFCCVEQGNAQAKRLTRSETDGNGLFTIANNGDTARVDTVNLASNLVFKGPENSSLSYLGSNGDIFIQRLQDANQNYGQYLGTDHQLFHDRESTLSNSVIEFFRRGWNGTAYDITPSGTKMGGIWFTRATGVGTQVRNWMEFNSTLTDNSTGEGYFSWDIEDGDATKNGELMRLTNETAALSPYRFNLLGDGTYGTGAESTRMGGFDTDGNVLDNAALYQFTGTGGATGVAVTSSGGLDSPSNSQFILNGQSTIAFTTPQLIGSFNFAVSGGVNGGIYGYTTQLSGLTTRLDFQTSGNPLTNTVMQLDGTDVILPGFLAGAKDAAATGGALGVDAAGKLVTFAAGGAEAIINETFFIDPAGTTGTKGSQSSPYPSPFDVTADLGATYQTIDFHAGEYEDAPTYAATNSHVINADSTFVDGNGAVIIANNYLGVGAAFYADYLTANTYEPRYLKLRGGDYVVNGPSNTAGYFLSMRDTASVVDIDIPSLTTTGNSPSGFEFAGNGNIKVGRFVNSGGLGIKLVPTNPGGTFKSRTTGRNVTFEIDDYVSTTVFRATSLFQMESNASTGEYGMNLHGTVGKVTTEGLSEHLIALHIDTLVNSNVVFDIGSVLSKSTSGNNHIFGISSWFESSMYMSNSTVTVNVGAVENWLGTLAKIESVSLDNSVITINVESFNDNAGSGLNASIIDIKGVSLTNNSRIIINCKSCIQGTTPSFGVIQFAQTNITTDATSEIVIEGSYATPNAAAVIVRANNTGRIRLNNFHSKNDGSIATILSDFSSPTFIVSGAYDGNASPVIDGTITFTKDYEYGASAGGAADGDGLFTAANSGDTIGASFIARHDGSFQLKSANGNKESSLIFSNTTSVNTTLQDKSIDGTIASNIILSHDSQSNINAAPGTGFGLALPGGNFFLDADTTKMTDLPNQPWVRDDFYVLTADAVGNLQPSIKGLYSDTTIFVTNNDILSITTFPDHEVFTIHSTVTSGSSSDNDIILPTLTADMVNRKFVVINDDSDTDATSGDYDTAVASGSVIISNGKTISGYIMAAGEVATFLVVNDNGTFQYHLTSSVAATNVRQTITAASPTIQLERGMLVLLDAATQGATTNTLATSDLEDGDMLQIIILGADSGTSTLDLDIGNIVWDTLAGSATEAFSGARHSFTGTWDDVNDLLVLNGN